VEHEEAELKGRAEAEPMPTSIEAFKHHPTYLLERHLGAWALTRTMPHLYSLMCRIMGPHSRLSQSPQSPTDPATYHPTISPTQPSTPPTLISPNHDQGTHTQTRTGRWEIIWPRKPVSIYKGEAVFLREHVKPGRTLNQVCVCVCVCVCV
jgi:hypothetical protein